MARKTTRYGNLKRKIAYNRQKDFKLSSVISNLSASFFPGRQPAEQKQEAPEDKSAQYREELLGKMDQQRQQYEKALSDSNKSSSKTISALQEQISAGRKHSLEVSESLKNAISSLAKRQSQGQKPQSTTPEETTEEGQQFAYNPIDAILPETSTKTDTEEKEKTDEDSTVDKTIKKLSIGQHVNVGKYSYKITNTFGIRSGANTVPGREGEHSRGIDLVGFDDMGNRTNMPISLTHGKIIEVGMQGDGSQMLPSEGRSGGAYMRILMPDGKVGTYAHLDKSIMNIKDKLVGTSVKRGQALFDMPEGQSYYDWTGSGTGARQGNTGHIKFMVSSVNSDGTLSKDYEKNNPELYVSN